MICKICTICGKHIFVYEDILKYGYQPEFISFSDGIIYKYDKHGSHIMREHDIDIKDVTKGEQELFVDCDGTSCPMKVQAHTNSMSDPFYL